jgi:hypothetical protein
MHGFVMLFHTDQWVFMVFLFLNETLVIPKKNVDGLTIMEIVTQSVGEHDHQVPLQLRNLNEPHWG